MRGRKPAAVGAQAAPRDKPWLFRTYAGHSTAAKSNELYRTNLAKGQPKRPTIPTTNSRAARSARSGYRCATSAICVPSSRAYRSGK
jgi:methylmalonyl-CoA mutase N-terminal domain/subunit